LNAGPTDAKLLVIISLANRWSMGWLLKSTTETAIVEKPAEEEPIFRREAPPV